MNRTKLRLSVVATAGLAVVGACSGDGSKSVAIADPMARFDPMMAFSVGTIAAVGALALMFG